jgi:hypothetical protein
LASRVARASPPHAFADQMYALPDMIFQGRPHTTLIRVIAAFMAMEFPSLEGRSRNGAPRYLRGLPQRIQTEQLKRRRLQISP